MMHVIWDPRQAGFRKSEYAAATDWHDGQFVHGTMRDSPVVHTHCAVLASRHNLSSWFD
jgi:hypothetical protein